jgi:AraC family transcriptional regulator
MQQPEFRTLPQKKLVGRKMRMSFAGNKTSELWRSFMPRRQEITNNVTSDLISLQVCKPAHFEKFDPAGEFVKWALVEVTDFDDVPDEMETFILAGGLYAVFTHKGLSTDNSTFQYIFNEWLPSSDYQLDDRPHFEVLGAGYKNNDPDSEEQIWIPVRPKKSSA